MCENGPDPHDVPGFNRASGVDDVTPRHEYHDEPPEHDPRRPRADELREAAADELREAAEHVEAGDADRADECVSRARKFQREAKQLEIAGEDA
jgi:hypothetical protein